ncbi:hypothetical protein GUJ93_ZPchr0013g35164 [Zizania palustris]|uniref:Reverse transcriptase domain-containing protein n=1 Tax=Zizania palustris TaxID=103762 RepID=A0A8J6BYY5_ZIZPA|nr:hypothetical protein GUJ93_ZPchr0013g35164 [Zizania palustris]
MNWNLENCRTILLFLDSCEDQRSLSLAEYNFRLIIKDSITSLLQFIHAYWKQRYTVRWTQLGDENTKYFHAAASDRLRHNTIASITLPNGTVLYSQEEKAEVFLDSFLGRMGFSSAPQMLFNLTELIPPHQSLDHLAAPFLLSDITSVVQNMPSSKAPGPDGFNGHFFKKCWHIIKDDIFSLCQDFFNHKTDLRPINNSYIILVPKKSNPTMVNDYRPISLVNSVIKIITKLLANRLQPLMPSIIHGNQYGFVKGRSIQDCLAWTFEYTHQCHCSKDPVALLKLDFEKAFDTVEHSTILLMLSHLGFPSCWIRWISSLLLSAHSAVVLNGIIGKFFTCKRGVRQGDPLSPLLFIIASDLLQYVLNEAAARGVVKAPPCHHLDDFPIVQYVDDTIVFLEATQWNVFALKALLNSFSASTGLKINFDKSCLVPINMERLEAESLAHTFGCGLGSFPFTYLGLPLGIRRPRFQDFTSLISKMEQRLVATSYWLSFAGRLQIINAVLSALPTYTMCMFHLPVKVVSLIDRIRRQCLWRGSSIQNPKLPLVAWRQVCRPKNFGGLGVINLRIQNTALLMKHLAKFYNKQDAPWIKLVWQHYYNLVSPPHLVGQRGSPWWKDILKLWPLFCAIAKPIVGCGTTISLWHDLWSPMPLAMLLPRLFSFAKSKKISLACFCKHPELSFHFFLPLSPEALCEFQQLQTLSLALGPLSDSRDSWTLLWGSSNFRPHRFYNSSFANSQVHPLFPQIWKTQCSNKIKVFFSLLLLDRLNTREILKRKKILLDSSDCLCILCSRGILESSMHLFFQCDFSVSCWSSVGICWDSSPSAADLVENFRRVTQWSFPLELIFVSCWSLWIHRNNCIFRNQQPSRRAWLSLFRSELGLQSHRFNPRLKSIIASWSNRL